ncbi:unnamed protein product [Natator depressus]
MRRSRVGPVSGEWLAGSPPANQPGCCCGIMKGPRTDRLPPAAAGARGLKFCRSASKIPEDAGTKMCLPFWHAVHERNRILSGLSTSDCSMNYNAFYLVSKDLFLWA